MNDDDVLNHFRAAGALLEGHFILTSGLRSPMYLQCARVLMHPQRAQALCRELADRIIAGLGPDAFDLVVSPAMGGVVVGYEMGRQLGLPAIFTERVDGEFLLRRGFEIEPGARVLMAEDIVTTGLSSRECIACIGGLGGEVVAASCLIDRSAGKADVGVPLYSLVAMEVPAYPADELPQDLAALPAVKPGSRGLK
ncbi:MAG: orotate phosphoribosyltransferase [Alphaproteobacteria bacterium]|jgi:orotate phosphoribosyltransferase|nr:orotate phosphoribosyltransferase [Alphaproteobacteria bacterium]MDP6563492.1 orotate phosphoribosyltransferase [Alphaproteobacteria bacterium]MDP6812678.1 orotate phosphoribosyltransferase [Alphaproteobacteria bacterium]